MTIKALSFRAKREICSSVQCTKSRILVPRGPLGTTTLGELAVVQAFEPTDDLILTLCGLVKSNHLATVEFVFGLGQRQFA